MIYWTKRTVSNFIILTFGLIALVLVLWTLGASAKVLMAAFALAYLTHPLVLWLERHRVNRHISIASVFIGAIAGIVFSLMALIPFLAAEIQNLLTSLPSLIQNLAEHIKSLATEWRIPIPFEPSEILSYLQDHLSEFLQSVSGSAWQSAKSLWVNSVAGFLWLLNLFLFPVFYFYLMTDYEKISHLLHDSVPPSVRIRFRKFGIRVEEIMAGYIRGQLLVCLALAFIYSFGLSLLNIKFGVLIGLIGGILTAIPYVGFSTLVTSSLVIAITTGASMPTYVGLLILYCVAQIIETYVLTPRLVGHRVGLGPLATLLVLIAGANLGGAFGMMISIPIGGILKVIAQEIWHIYHRSSVYLDT